MENKFKVGDKVKIIKACVMCDQKYIGNIVTIKEFDEEWSERFFVKENERPWLLEEVEQIIISKNDLRDGDIVTLRNGDRLVLLENDFVDMSDDNNNYLEWLSEVNNDLTYSRSNNKNYDIVKVERPSGYNTVYTRQEEAKKMTVAQICKELGYDIEIIKEEN